MNAGHLHSDLLIRAATRRAIHVVIVELRASGLVPCEVDVPLIAFRSQIANRSRARFIGRERIDLDLIDQQNVVSRVGRALHEQDAIQQMGFELRHRRRFESLHRDLHLHPPVGRQVFGECAEFQRLGEVLVGIFQHQAWQVSRRERLRRIHPKGERVARKIEHAISELIQMQLRQPETFRLRVPFESQGIRAGIEGLAIDRNPLADQLQHAGSGSFASTVEVRIRRGAVIEKDSLVVGGVGAECSGERDEKEVDQTSFHSEPKKHEPSERILCRVVVWWKVSGVRFQVSEKPPIRQPPCHQLFLKPET